MIPSISRILFATDLSPNATLALRHAAGLAKSTDAEIHILHVCEALSEDAKITLMMFMQDETLRRNALSRRVELARKTLSQRQENFWSKLPEEDRKIRDQVVSTEVVEGFPGEEILRHAADKNCDLIVLGAHEHGLSHTFLGSVAKRVLSQAEIPTLMVPYGHGDDADLKTVGR